MAYTAMVRNFRKDLTAMDYKILVVILQTTEKNRSGRGKIEHKHVYSAKPLCVGSLTLSPCLRAQFVVMLSKSSQKVVLIGQSQTLTVSLM